MAEYVHLVGSEDVSRAGHNMQAAAEQMTRAASQISFALDSHQAFLTQWLQDLDGTLIDRISDLGTTLGPLT